MTRSGTNNETDAGFQEGHRETIEHVTRRHEEYILRKWLITDMPGKRRRSKTR